MTKLNRIKSFHTLIWIFFNVVIIKMAISISCNKIDTLFWICTGLIIMEAAVLLIFKGICPLSIIARKYTDSAKPNFDIFLPEWLAKYNKIIYGSIVLFLFGKLVYDRYC